MADSIQEKILATIQDTYVPFLKILISFVEKNEIGTEENLGKLKAIYEIFTTAPPAVQVRTFLDNRTKLETWYKKAEKKKRSPDSSDNESSQEVPRLTDDDTSLMHASQHCGVSLPQSDLTVSLVKLPDHLIHYYTTEENKENVGKTPDQVTKGTASPCKVVACQEEDTSRNLNTEEQPSESALKERLETNISQKETDVSESMKEQMNSKIELYTKLFISESKVNMLLQENLSKDKEIGVLKSRNEEIKTKYTKLKTKKKKLKQSITDKEGQFSTMTEENEKIKGKYTKMKTKYKNLKKSISDKPATMTGENRETEAKYTKLKTKFKNLKRSILNRAEGQFSTMAVEHGKETTVIGPSLTVNTYKLSCCRTKDFSKFTADLLEVAFGQKKLGTGVLKGPVASLVLNPDMLTDIQMYVSKKFNVSVREVRSVIRNKLNSCHKAYKKAKCA